MKKIVFLLSQLLQLFINMVFPNMMVAERIN